MILITGATGFLGKELLKRIFSERPTLNIDALPVYGASETIKMLFETGILPYRHKEKSFIRVVSRNEAKLIELKDEFPEIEIITGDIAEEHICKKALKDVKTVFHLAAFKHVGLAEDQPYQCVNSNVIGTANLLKHFRGETFIAISTDKAAQINGVYGATKFLMERLIAEYESLQPETKYRVVRYGNVLYSSGSVLCKWKDALLNGQEITITEPNATRFFWTVTQAVDLIFECLKKAKDSTPYIPKMKGMKVGDLLEAMQIKYGKAIKINQIGLQPGENFHETMDGIIFSNNVEQYSIPEILELI